LSAALLHKILARLMTLLTRRDVPVEEEGSSDLADSSWSEKPEAVRGSHSLKLRVGRRTWAGQRL
jgi:hypothetical protein